MPQSTFLSVNEKKIKQIRLFSDLLSNRTCPPPLNDVLVKGVAFQFDTAFVTLDMSSSSSTLQQGLFQLFNDGNKFLVSTLKEKLAPMISAVRLYQKKEKKVF